MDHRLSRRHRIALSLGALILAVPGVASCGFNYATDRENTISNGTSDKSGTVDVLNAVIVSQDDGSGTFIATLSNNSATETIHMSSLDFGSNSTTQVAAFDPIEVKPHAVVNLTNGQGIKVSGDFKAGDFLSLTVGFDNGESADMKVHVVVADDEYEGYDNGTGSPAPAPTASAS
ncbi:hypothetical protein ISU07_20250 [Nocardioides islandensis]|uniref:DUF461 domain-containing protein n=1 Tax=Nocardioides islandensis TaxID=433663 RepID=A0A930VIN7_9ACTN|nr:hypothetical protein [Nocardioides islandensis]MBF4765470.1 hypothetical protein [Nocardioides islandensis]